MFIELKKIIFISNTMTSTTSTAPSSNTAKLTPIEMFAFHFASIPKEHCICFTDGACFKNPGPAGVGVLMLGHAIAKNAKNERAPLAKLSRFIGPQGTNNIAELYAIYVALMEFQPQNERYTYHDSSSFLRATRKCDLTIVTDSKYAIGVLSQNWKAKANQSLIQRIKDRMADLVTEHSIAIHFLWSPGHSGIQYNEVVDQLAKQGAQQKIRLDAETKFFNSL